MKYLLDNRTCYGENLRHGRKNKGKEKCGIKFCDERKHNRTLESFVIANSMGMIYYTIVIISQFHFPSDINGWYFFGSLKPMYKFLLQMS